MTNGKIKIDNANNLCHSLANFQTFLKTNANINMFCPNIIAQRNTVLKLQVSNSKFNH
jgi:hypothetical protein